MLELPPLPLYYIGYNLCNEKGQVVYKNLPLSVAEEVAESETEKGHPLYHTIVVNRQRPPHNLSWEQMPGRPSSAERTDPPADPSEQ
jgi:hypothetical protein